MYRGEPNIRQFLVTEQKERLRHADESFALSRQVSELGRVGVRNRVSDARDWALSWRWPHEGGHWQRVHTTRHWQWPHTGGHWQSPHRAGHAH